MLLDTECVQVFYTYHCTCGCIVVSQGSYSVVGLRLDEQCKVPIPLNAGLVLCMETIMNELVL